MSLAEQEQTPEIQTNLFGFGTVVDRDINGQTERAVITQIDEASRSANTSRIISVEPGAESLAAGGTGKLEEMQVVPDAPKWNLETIALASIRGLGMNPEEQPGLIAAYQDGLKAESEKPPVEFAR